MNMDDNKEEPIAEVGVSRDLSNQCTYKGSNNDASGAGANASSRTEMIFVTATPLSELVWSPHQGVSLKCADCSLPDKRLSFMCGIGSNNMVLQPPPSVIAWETNDNVDMAETTLMSSSQIESHLAYKVSEKVNLVGSPRSATGIEPMCQITSNDHNQGPSGDPELTREMKLSFLNTNQEDDLADKKDKNKHVPTNSQSTDTSGTRENILSRFPEKSFMRGADKGRSSDSSSIKLYKPKADLAQKELECGELNKATSSAPVQGSRDVGREPDGQNPITIVLESEKEQLALGNVEGKCKLNTNPPFGKQESTSENDLQPHKGKSASAEVGFIEPKPTDEANQSSYQNEGLRPSGMGPSVKASPDSSRVPLFRRKDKEIAVFNEEHNEKLSKDKDDSHESVESCNSTGLLSLGKRKWSFDQQMIVRSKKMKQKHHENSQFGPSNKQDSSFMNWISNMVKGLSKSGLDETPSLDLNLRASHHGNRSHDTGFQTVFKALYCSSSRDHNKILPHDNNPEDSLKELDNCSSPIAGDERVKCKELVISTEKFNKSISNDGEGPSVLPNFTSANISVVEENHKVNAARKNSFCNIPCSPKKVGVISSSSSFRNDSDSPSEGKEACKLGSVDPNKSVANRSDSLGSLWITRFSPKVSNLKINLSSHHQVVNASLQTDSTKVFSHAQNCVVSVRDPNAFEDGCKPSTSSFVSKRRGRCDEKKFKSKLNPFHISQRFKNSEALASVFAKRLDALRHIIPSEVVGNTNYTTTACFFCGAKGHKLQDCSEITGSEIEDLLTKINSYDGTDESLCFCIRCFQLNHWAISCPNSSWRKEKNHADGSASLVNFKGFGEVQQILGNGTQTNNELRNLTDKKDLQYQAMVGTTVDKRMSGRMILNASTSNLKPAEKELLHNDFCDETAANLTSKEEFTLNGKQTVSSSTENESKENQITSFCNLVNRHIPAVPRATFETIKRLRLSRTDILKWMKSPLSRSCLDGFFLRLRLRKWEEGLGGTGYFVACINGSSGEGSFGSPKFPLAVNIAGFKCLIESRFISNNDFAEDELMAWWCATLRSGDKMPSQEDMKTKLEEKKKLGF